jgi:hypothetical protein
MTSQRRRSVCVDLRSIRYPSNRSQRGTDLFSYLGEGDSESNAARRLIILNQAFSSFPQSLQAIFRDFMIDDYERGKR